MNLNQVTVPSIDIVRSLQFYSQLGLKLIVNAVPHYLRFECPEGDATFSVHKVAQLSEGEGIYVYFECADLDLRVQALQEGGMVFDQLPVDQKWLWREARLRDPDGNTLILYHAGENRKNPPWRWEEAENDRKEG
ncbi:MAG: VOC family protein [Bacteroidota bacterium]